MLRILQYLQGAFPQIKISAIYLGIKFQFESETLLLRLPGFGNPHFLLVEEKDTQNILMSIPYSSGPKDLVIALRPILYKYMINKDL